MRPRWRTSRGHQDLQGMAAGTRNRVFAGIEAPMGRRGVVCRWHMPQLPAFAAGNMLRHGCQQEPHSRKQQCSWPARLPQRTCEEALHKASAGPGSMACTVQHTCVSRSRMSPWDRHFCSSNAKMRSIPMLMPTAGTCLPENMPTRLSYLLQGTGVRARAMTCWACKIHQAHTLENFSPACSCAQQHSNTSRRQASLGGSRLSKAHLACN